MEISGEHKEYLKNKHQGGINNSKGNAYETIYATKEIVRLFASGANIETTFVGAQLEDVFVDDFLIVENDFKTYHQLKEKKNLSWGNNQKGDLLYDFSWQKSYSQAVGEKFNLKIVYSQQDCKMHREDIPEAISSVTIKEYFPSFQNLTSLIQQSGEVRADLQSIMNYPGEDFPLDMQYASIEFIKSQYMELTASSTLVSLAEIREAYERKHPECPNFKDCPNVVLPKDILETLELIGDFVFTVNGNMLNWRYRRISGTTILTPEVISRICEERPREIFDLITLLN